MWRPSSWAASILAIDEARARFDKRKTPGGDTPYLQEQNYSLAALAKRDALPNPFGAKAPAAAAARRSLQQMTTMRPTKKSRRQKMSHAGN
jgi:hypothetical protein